MKRRIKAVSGSREEEEEYEPPRSVNSSVDTDPAVSLIRCLGIAFSESKARAVNILYTSSKREQALNLATRHLHDERVDLVAFALALELGPASEQRADRPPRPRGRLRPRPKGSRCTFRVVTKGENVGVKFQCGLQRTKGESSNFEKHFVSSGFPATLSIVPLESQSTHVYGQSSLTRR